MNLKKVENAGERRQEEVSKDTLEQKVNISVKRDSLQIPAKDSVNKQSNIIKPDTLKNDSLRVPK